MSTPSTTAARAEPIRVAIAGLGAIGFTVAQALDRGLPGFTLTAIGVRDRAKAEARLQSLRHPVPLVTIAELEPLADLVIECAPASILCSIAEPVLKAGKKVMILSVGALLTNEHLVELARASGGQIIVPSGALLGLDALLAAAEGEIRSVRMASRKPAQGFAGAPFLEERNIRIEDITEPLRIFSGSPREAAVGFPANMNVAVALSLAGIGPDRTVLEIWADPTITRNTHTIEVEADSASFQMSIANVPSENPKTSRITALSVIATLRKMTAPLRLGT
ncbi:aspartate dehydrogenase [Rhodoligotrophos appendicifer]|uniref:aspartate dehydrogenase n=1 Tax=Rhodoligotrophos appendicifer TaxID=987056 RepID=UPI00117FC3F0|nr:aspartate dehydrogenase [Rhodoligotrophos appendicifer]